MKKYKSRWSYDPQAKYRTQELSDSPAVIILKAVVGTIAVWLWVCVMLLNQ